MTTKRGEGEPATLVTVFSTVVLLTLILDACQKEPAAIFKDKDTLLRPIGYREWVFVGSSLGLRYGQNPVDEYKNVYINPSSFRAFIKTGEFPDGTVMILEFASVGKAPRGSFQDAFTNFQASVKDSQRFDTVWAYFKFYDDLGQPKDTATPEPKEACWSCHRANAATDNIFTQFYPVLRAVAS